MKTKKLERIKDFKNKEIESHQINGGYDGVIQTGAGEFAGMKYTSDHHNDEDGNGLLSIGESITFSWDSIAHRG